MIPKTHLYKLQERKCFYCDKKFKLNQLTIDHFYPKTYGNTLLNNKVLACKKCNGKKGA